MYNLWENHDELIAGKQAAKPARAVRSATEAAITSALREWLLRDYAVPYCRVLAATRIFRRCYLVDALGGSRNSFASMLQKSEEVAQDLAGETRPMLLHSLLLAAGKPEKRPGKAPSDAQTANAQAMFVLPGASAIVEAGGLEAMPALLAAIEQYASLFLLNPFAPLTFSPSKRDVPFFTYDDLAPFTTRTAPTELCLLISHAQIEGRLLPALRKQPGATAFTALLRSDRWKALLANETQQGQAGDREKGWTGDHVRGWTGDHVRGWTGDREGRPYTSIADGLIGFLQKAIQPHFLWVQRFAFPMLTGPATVEETPFELLFATRRQDSLLCMNDAVCGYRRRLEDLSYRGLLNEAWFLEQQRARLSEATHVLKDHILELGYAQSPRRWPELRQHVLLAHFGRYMVSEYDEIIAGLLEAGAIQCEWRQRSGGVESADLTTRRIPGNNDILLWRGAKRHY